MTTKRDNILNTSPQCKECKRPLTKEEIHRYTSRDLCPECEDRDQAEFYHEREQAQSLTKGTIR